MNPANKTHLVPGWTTMQAVLLLALCIHYCLSHTGEEKWCFNTNRFNRQKCLGLNNKCKPCGDNLCKCFGDKAACVLDYTDTSQMNIQSVPRLPKKVKLLHLLTNEVNSTPLYEQLFCNVTEITQLSLAVNDVVSIPPGAFRLLHKLTCLNLDHQPLYRLNFSDIRNALSSAPSLQYFSASRSMWNGLEDCNFLGIVSNIREMRFANNYPIYRPIDFDLGCFCIFQSIEVLNLNTSGLKNMTLNCTLNIRTLLLHNNELQAFNFPLDPYDNMLLPHLEYLDLSIGYFDMLMQYIPNLRFLDMTHNCFLRYTSPFKEFDFPKLEILFLGYQSKDRYSTVAKLFGYDPPLKVLSLAGNRQDFAQEAYKCQLSNVTTLLNLTMDDNDFLNVDDKKFENLFGSMSLLQVLSMRKCNLERVFMRMFTLFPRLQCLDLSMNRISDSVFPNGAFDPLQHLTFLSLSRNKLSSVTENKFSSVLTGQLRTLSFSENPFVCSCDLLWFKTWLHRERNLFGDTHDYFCDNIPHTSLAEFTLTEQQCLLSHQASVLIITVCSLMIITLTTFTLLFSYRWHIRLLLYEAFRGHGDVRRQRLLANNFDYDVFVSYASEDLPWVRERLMPELEGNLGLRLCIHERDFIAGNNIVDNIAECVESSKKILMVFSKDFVLSQWCQFELSFCLRHVMDHDDVLIIVCVDDVTSRRMTMTMMAVLKTTTYIQWEDLDDAVNAFWGRLRLALNEIFIGENQV